MRFLDELELFLEEQENYKIMPLDYDADSGNSFGIITNDNDKKSIVARVAIKTADGVPIDALAGNYNYDDVYADISLEGDIDDPSKADVMLWTLDKIKSMGYDGQTIRFDNNVYYDSPETLSDITNDDNELSSPDEDMDISTYWDEDESNKDGEIPSEFEKSLTSNVTEFEKSVDSNEDEDTKDEDSDSDEDGVDDDKKKKD